jgi:hypothetical protein
MKLFIFQILLYIFILLIILIRLLYRFTQFYIFIFLCRKYFSKLRSFCRSCISRRNLLYILWGFFKNFWRNLFYIKLMYLCGGRIFRIINLFLFRLILIDFHLTLFAIANNMIIDINLKLLLINK